MDSQARDILAQAVALYRDEMILDSRRCEAYLADLLGNSYPKELAVTVAAVRASVPAELAQLDEKSIAETVIARCTKRLQDTQGLEASAARWSVESWALALGVAKKRDLSFEIECPACRSKARVMTWLAGRTIACPACRAGVLISIDRMGLSLDQREDTSTPTITPSTGWHLIGELASILADIASATRRGK